MKPAQRKAGKVPGGASDFWRLLGDYEDLSTCETAALCGEDFTTVASIQAMKAVIFTAMDDSCHQSGVDRREPSIRQRLEKIAEGERSNHAFITRRLATNAAERRALNSARARLRSLQHSYVSVEPRTDGAFLAVG
jgi:hypothetical protein